MTAVDIQKLKNYIFLYLFGNGFRMNREKKRILKIFQNDYRKNKYTTNLQKKILKYINLSNSNSVITYSKKITMYDIYYNMLNTGDNFGISKIFYMKKIEGGGEIKYKILYKSKKNLYVYLVYKNYTSNMCGRTSLDNLNDRQNQINNFFEIVQVFITESLKSLLAETNLFDECLQFTKKAFRKKTDIRRLIFKNKNVCLEPIKFLNFLKQ